MVVKESVSARFARRIRELRESNGWSQTEVSSRLAEFGQTIGPSRISSIELRGQGVTLDLAEAFSQAFDVPLWTLLDLDDDIQAYVLEHVEMIQSLLHAASQSAAELLDRVT